MNERVDERRARLDPSITDAIDMACRLAAEDAIGGLRVAIDRRPTYAELLRYRRRAERCGLTLTMSAASLSLRPRHAAGWGNELENDTPAWLARLWRYVQDHLLGTAGRGNVDRPGGETTAGGTPVDGVEPPGPACHPPPATFLQRRYRDVRCLRDAAGVSG